MTCSRASRPATTRSGRVLPVTPQRIQLKRARGWRLPEGAIKVDRTTKWGNPFKVGEPIERGSTLWPYLDFLFGMRGLTTAEMTSMTLLHAADAVNCYERWLADQPALFLAAIEELRGHDLACWCKPDAPACHADALIDLCNG